MTASKPETVQGRLPAKLGNDISDAIYAAVERGMEVDEAVSVALKVLCDYGVRAYGQQYIQRLCETLPALAAHNR